MSFLVRHVGLPIAEKLKGWPIRRYLRELEESQWWPPEQLRQLQNEKLARLVEHSYATVPFYREVFDSRGLRPEDVRTVDDLVKLPIVTKAEIRENFPDRIVSEAFKNTKLVTLTSSGSTGEPFRYYLSEDEKARKWAGLFRFWTWAGFRLGDRYAVLGARPYRAFQEGFLSFLEAKFSGVLNIPAFDMYEGAVGEYVRKLVKFRPLMLRGYSSCLHFLAETVKRQGINISLKAVCSTGETLFDFQRELIESVFKCKVYDAYGGEGMETAGQCDVGTYHINAEGVYVEIVDDQGSRLPPGASGQIVLTDLNHYSMPFIRYNIQDMGILSDKRCACGRGLPVFEKILGRLADIGVTPSGKAIVVEAFHVIFMKHVDAAASFQVVQERPDLVVLNIVPGPRFEELRSAVMHAMQETVGDDVTVQLEVVDRIPPLKSGKRRTFISKCGIQAASRVVEDG